jgi:anti-anti-sigma factor
VTIQVLPDRGDGVRLLFATGELDVATVPPMLAGVAELVAGARAVVVDLTEVEFFDSSGVRLVDRFARECAAAGVMFRVVAPPGGIARRVLELVGLDSELATDDLSSALDAVEAQ